MATILERRAAIHAALADPARLRIVDHLAFGDASSTELATLLAMPSNLLAHHLGVLERAGLVARHRSEADRRRSYLRLLPDALDGLLPTGVTPVPRVVFVCTANSARSQLAAALWTRASARARDLGRHPPRVRHRDAAPRGPPASTAWPWSRTPRSSSPRCSTRPTSWSRSATTPTRSSTPAPSGVHWSVPDPVRVGTAAAFDAAYDDLATRVAHLAPRLTATAS